MTTRQLASDSAKHSLARGAAGQALLSIEQARAGQGSWAKAHEHVMRLTGVPVAAHIESSLFEGATAVAYVLASSEQTAYEPALATLDRYIDELTRGRLRRAHQRIDGGLLPELREFDLISGLTGLGVYQLRRRCGGEVLREVLQYLVRLCQPMTNDGVPGWWTANDTADLPSDHWPGGHGNFGIAHGISGPLALMALAARRGVQVPGQLEAIRAICSWLDRWKQGDAEAAWWPGTITRREHQTDLLSQAGPQRPSWCYSTPGIARAQQLAGLALNDPERQHLAESALHGCITDAAQLTQLRDTSLCHGWAGLVQASRRATADAGPESPLAPALPELTHRLNELVRTDESHGYPELLEGRIGVELVQISAASTVESIWDVCLLLSG
ncbi:lanthionine synthetase C family protein [Kribbella sp. NPDC051587]|uniref:lanthionine synthetase C family protein n=1 Tax=Kribbella sp. NPDC051587 TaxID=3364119 RepID=UPI0037951EB2